MQHALVALQLEKPSSYSIYNFVISLFGCPLPWMPGAVVPFAPPPYARHWRRDSQNKKLRQY